MAGQKKKAASTAKKKAKITPAEELQLPTVEAIEEARRRRKEAMKRGVDHPGKIYGLPEGWVGAVVDPSLSEGQRARIHARWTAKGWTKLDGLHSVDGYDLGGIVYVKTQEDYDKSRAERDQRIKEARSKGLMH